MRGGQEDPGRGPSAARPLAWAIVGLVVLGLGGFLIDGASRPADPRLIPAPDPTAHPGAPAMGAALLSVHPGGGAPSGGAPSDGSLESGRAAVCVLEAVTPRQQQYGLMNRTSLGTYAGMAFVFARPSMDRFYMRDTRIPLSIAWFDPAGRFEAETLMAPCPDRVAVCPTYGPGRPYTLAVEVPAGKLADLGIGPGSVAGLGGPCG